MVYLVGLKRTNKTSIIYISHKVEWIELQIGNMCCQFELIIYAWMSMKCTIFEMETCEDEAKGWGTD